MHRCVTLMSLPTARMSATAPTRSPAQAGHTRGSRVSGSGRSGAGIVFRARDLALGVPEGEARDVEPDAAPQRVQRPLHQHLGAGDSSPAAIAGLAVAWTAPDPWALGARQTAGGELFPNQEAQDRLVQ